MQHKNNILLFIIVYFNIGTVCIKQNKSNVKTFSDSQCGKIYLTVFYLFISFIIYFFI